MRLIDAHRLHNTLYEAYEKNSKDGKEYICEFMSKQIEPILFAAPTVDAVEIVRCGECTMFQEKYRGFGLCKKHNGILKSSDYCSYGERKENGT